MCSKGRFVVKITSTVNPEDAWTIRGHGHADTLLKSPLASRLISIAAICTPMLNRTCAVQQTTCLSVQRENAFFIRKPTHFTSLVAPLVRDKSKVEPTCKGHAATDKRYFWLLGQFLPGPNHQSVYEL